VFFWKKEYQTMTYWFSEVGDSPERLERMELKRKKAKKNFSNIIV
tara:strand:+ start:47 stop:181 length:135 start_codon:yes stop_codon:yes gene_type:complete